MQKTVGQRKLEKLKEVLDTLNRFDQQKADLAYQAKAIIESSAEAGQVEGLLDQIIERATHAKGQIHETGGKLQAAGGHLVETVSVLEDARNKRYTLVDIITLLQNETEFIKGDPAYCHLFLDSVDIPILQQCLIATEPGRREILLKAISDVKEFLDNEPTGAV